MTYGPDLSEPMTNTLHAMIAAQPEDSIVVVAKSTDEHPRALLAITLGEHPDVAVSFDEGVSMGPAMMPYERLVAGIIASQQPGHVERVMVGTTDDIGQLASNLTPDMLRGMVESVAENAVDSRMPRYTTSGFIRLEEGKRPIPYFIDLETAQCGIRTEGVEAGDREAARRIVTAMAEGMGMDGVIRKRPGYDLVHNPESDNELRNDDNVQQWYGWSA